MNNRYGFSFVELLFAVFILAMILSAVVGVYKMATYMQKDSEFEASLYAQGVKSLDLIERGEQGLQGLVKARSNSVQISNGNSQIDFAVDDNAEYTQSTADDRMMRVYFASGDGNSSTFDDNEVLVMKDSSMSGSGNLISAARNVESVQFQKTGDLVTASLTMAVTVRGQVRRLSITRSILLRN